MRPRVVLLGASNIARGLAAAVAAACRVRPRAILLAAGRGRAYSRASQLLVRGLPSILDCGLWRLLSEQRGEQGSGQAPELFALVTDLGNDLVYGASIDQTFDAVGVAIERLLSAGARPVVTTLPLISLDRFPGLWLDTVRRTFFPSSALSVPTLIERAHHLDEKLRQHCTALDLPLVEQEADWYGLDPIHHKLTRQTTAFEAMTGAWQYGDTPRRPSFDLRRRLALAWPESSSLFGRPHRRAQPCARLSGETDLLLF